MSLPAKAGFCNFSQKRCTLIGILGPSFPPSRPFTQNRTCPGLNKILLWLGASLQCRRDFVRPESIPCAPVLSAGCWPLAFLGKKRTTRHTRSGAAAKVHRLQRNEKVTSAESSGCNLIATAATRKCKRTESSHKLRDKSLATAAVTVGAN